MDSRLGTDSFIDRVRSVSNLADAAGTPQGQFPDYLKQYRAQYAKMSPDISSLQPPGDHISASMNNKWGTARASSYWGQNTVAGTPMSSTTIASPYLPLGTVVEIMRNGHRVKGTVQDFGPADWVMKGDLTRFLDIASPMMKQLTGSGDDLTGVQYRVLQYGKGRVYRPNSSVTRKLKKLWG